LIVACKAAQLDWETTLLILHCRPDYSRNSVLDFEQNKHIFEALSLSSAQRTLRFWSARSSAKKPDLAAIPVAMMGT
jgi:hypothetical protein